MTDRGLVLSSPTGDGVLTTIELDGKPVPFVTRATVTFPAGADRRVHAELEIDVPIFIRETRAVVGIQYRAAMHTFTANLEGPPRATRAGALRALADAIEEIG